MSIVKRHLAEQEERLILIEEICIDTGALVLGTATDEVYFSADEPAYKNAYVTVFQAWAKGTIKGTAEQISRLQNPFLKINKTPINRRRRESKHAIRLQAKRGSSAPSSGSPGTRRN